MNSQEIRQRADEAAGGLRTIGKRLVENPMAALLAALAAGFLAGMVLRFFETPRREE